MGIPIHSTGDKIHAFQDLGARHCEPTRVATAPSADAAKPVYGNWGEPRYGQLGQTGRRLWAYEWRMDKRTQIAADRARLAHLGPRQAEKDVHEIAEQLGNDANRDLLAADRRFLFASWTRTRSAAGTAVEAYLAEINSAKTCANSCRCSSSGFAALIDVEIGPNFTS
jgi:hypothetical protein